MKTTVEPQRLPNNNTIEKFWLTSEKWSKHLILNAIKERFRCIALYHANHKHLGL